MMNSRNGMRPVHPGEILREELNTIGLSANALSKELGVPVNRVTMILNGQRGVSADTALRLARYFGTTPQLWLNLQKTWELRRAEIEAGSSIAERVTPWISARCGRALVSGAVSGGLSIGKAYVSVEKQPVFDADTISRMRFQMTADSVTWTWRDKMGDCGIRVHLLRMTTNNLRSLEESLNG